MAFKFIFIIKITLVYMCLIVVPMSLRNIKKLNSKTDLQTMEQNKKNVLGIKYVLLWLYPLRKPFYDGEGRNNFVFDNCPYTNCIVTTNRNLLGDPSLFDAVVFHGPELIKVTNLLEELPKRRLPRQKYVFATIESAQNYPICSTKFDGYFNWTWTYKLNSDVRWGYIVVRDSKGNIIGPKKNMNWLDPNKMDPVSLDIKEKIKNKTKAAAWFVSNCITNSRREGFVDSLQKILLKRHLVLDIYGDCGQYQCPLEKENECNKIIEDDYYFYLSFENSITEDYVTEKLLIALQNNAVPIVYGGADYTQFLPPGSYLNARELGLFRLVDRMVELIREPELYAQYFRWKNHYSYHGTMDSVETNEYCQMCAQLNGDKMTKTSIYDNFFDWWDPIKVARECLTECSGMSTI